MDRPYALMDFPAAIAQVRAGQRITRAGWNDPRVFCGLAAGLLQIHTADGDDRGWLISEADLYARDWQTVADA